METQYAKMLIQESVARDNMKFLRTNDPAEVFASNVEQIKTRLKQIISDADGLFDVSPDDVTWAHVGYSRRILDALNEIMEVK